jgi:hypothetical protein
LQTSGKPFNRKGRKGREENREGFYNERRPRNKVRKAWHYCWLGGSGVGCCGIEVGPFIGDPKPGFWF